MLTMTKFLSGLLVLAPLLMARTGLTTDGEKYMAEAKKRIVKIEKEIDADAADPAKAAAATDDLLASKRFLDNVQKEQPKSAEAAKLQTKADALLAKLQPTMLQTAIKSRLDEVDSVLGRIETDVNAPTRDASTEQALNIRFEDLRGMVHDVLAKDPNNTRALADKQRENDLWQKYQQQRQAKQGAKP